MAWIEDARGAADIGTPAIEDNLGAAGHDPAETAHVFLRRNTRVWHDRIEASFAPFDLRTREGLQMFLSRQARAVLPLEAALRQRGIVEILPDWSERERGDALIADLDRLGLGCDEANLDVDLDRPDHLLGAAYVLEGSRLGGRVLARRVAASDDDDVRSVTAFLMHSGPPGGWASFLAVLDATERSSACKTALLAGAEQAFRAFDPGVAGS